ncbi:HlyD family efflux transporter periplasmic adaptor subunit [Agrobacterium tumefaciens]|uniref:HlyD family efflux transporter periplasmic adaptor subunit n=1 Tax=Agrobacterium tumefaciens TaxID=358 RepID=UPI0021CFD911|nr:HlyD family efflux transporter periplasmic adaptor subunit [Agrobacterium tumefaciens]UXS02413.1 HlyD family efflux transporter periplasmic adaptor subunit [Agrobacterium tumefaciens]
MKKALFALLLIVAAAAAWYWQDQRKAEETGILTLFGNVDIRQVSLAFDGSGRIAELNAEEGDRVTTGQVVGLLDNRTLELQANEQEANVDVQRQTLLKLRNGSRPEEIAQARAQLASAEASAARAEQDFTRASRLRSPSGGAISEQSYDQAQADARAATAKVNELRAALQLAEAGTRKEDIAAAEAQLKASEASLALLRHQIDQGQLRVPMDAVIRSRLHEPGDMVTSASPVFSLALTDPKWIRVYVDEADIGKIKPGMQARIMTDSHPDKAIEGKVGYISSVAEFTPKSVQTEELRTSLVYEVRVIVTDTENVLRLGQPATVRLQIGAPS